MFQIILWILKIIGILLAAILGIAVLLVCIVLFVPVRYQIEAESAGTFESIDAHARFSWLLYLFSGYFKYQNGEFCWQIRLACKKLNQTEHIEAIPNETHKKKKAKKSQENRKEEVHPKVEPTNIPIKKDFQEKKVRRNRTARKCRETAETAKKKKTSLIQKIKYTYQTMCDKVKVLLDKKEKLTEFLSEPIHKAAWIRLKREAFRILRFLRPKKLTGSVQFGLEDPYNTGRALAVLSMLYPLYGEHIDIYPNFEQQVLEGHLLIKGRIRGIYAVIVLWNLFFDKQIRTTYEHIKTFKL